MQNGLLKGKPVRGLVAAAALVAAGALGTEGYHRVWAAEPTVGGETQAARTLLVERTNALAEIENGFAAIAERIEPSVVSIEVQKKVSVPGGPNLDRLFRDFQFPGDEEGSAPGGDGRNRGQNRPRVFSFPPGGGMPQQFSTRGSGSGVIVAADGWILTNDHVVDGADMVTVKMHDGRTFTGTVRRDPRSDLAVVKVDASGLPAAEFADSEKVRVGQWAIAFGSPFELNDTMTVGIISARQRQKAVADGGTPRFYPNLIQTDASVNPGNSGGPLVDSRGRVLGINVAINSPTGGNVGIAFAIPANMAKNVMNQLIRTGKVVRGFLGVRPGALNPAARSQYKVTDGALIEEVNEDTPASRAGFQVEDVVVRYNGQAVRDDIQFRDMVARTAPGSKADVVVMRNGREQTLTVTVGEPPAEAAAAAPEDKPAPAAPEKKEGRLGVVVEPAGSDKAKELGVTASTGVAITQVEPGSPAAEEGLRPGDVILRANGREVKSADELKGAVGSLKAGESARLVVQRGKTRTLVAVAVR